MSNASASSATGIRCGFQPPLRTMSIVDIERPQRTAISLTEIPRNSISVPSTEPKGCRSGTPAAVDHGPMTTVTHLGPEPDQPVAAEPDVDHRGT